MEYLFQYSTKTKLDTIQIFFISRHKIYFQNHRNNNFISNTLSNHYFNGVQFVDNKKSSYSNDYENRH